MPWYQCEYRLAAKLNRVLYKRTVSQGTAEKCFTTGQSIGTKLKRVLYSRIVLWGRAEQSALQQNSPTGICYTYTRKWEVDAQRKNTQM